MSSAIVGMHSGSARRERSSIAPQLILGLGAALALRVALGAPHVATSQLGTFAFAAALASLAFVAGWRPSRPRVTGVVAGVAVAAFLVALSWWRLGLIPDIRWRAALTLWTPTVILVATTEEIVLRGVLFDAIARRRSDAAAVVVTAVLFSAIHFPLYGASVLPLDAAVGLMLGGVRLGWGVGSSITAHVVADLVAGISV